MHLARWNAQGSGLSLHIVRFAVIADHPSDDLQIDVADDHSHPATPAHRSFSYMVAHRSQSIDLMRRQSAKVPADRPSHEGS